MKYRHVMLRGFGAPTFRDVAQQDRESLQELGIGLTTRKRKRRPVDRLFFGMCEQSAFIHPVFDKIIDDGGVSEC